MVLKFDLHYFFSVQEDGHIGEIEDVTIHPLYQYARAYNDLAVIKLKASKGNQNFYIKRFFSNHLAPQSLEKVQGASSSTKRYK